MADFCQSKGLWEDCIKYLYRRIRFYESVYPALNGALAWALEDFGDILVQQRKADQNIENAEKIDAAILQTYSRSSEVLRLMFGETHEYTTRVVKKLASQPSSLGSVA